MEAPVRAVRSADASFRSLDHVAALDGVRGIAILIVLVHNAWYIAADSDRFALKFAAVLASTGWIGVQLFLVLSGYLITGILNDARGSERFFRTFYIRRTLRIFPLYYAFLGLALVIFP